MSKTRMPWWIKLIISIVSIAFGLVIAFGSMCIYVKVKYDINLVKTIYQVTVVAQEVNAEEKFPKYIREEDMGPAMNDINDIIPDLITYSEANGYEIGTPSGSMSGDLTLTERRVGALLTMLLNSSADASISIAGKNISFSLYEVSFSNITENLADFGVTIKLDIRDIKKEMDFFPASYIANKIPNNIYVKSIVTITKGENPFEYTTSGKGLSINNLDETETQEFLKAINSFVKFGSIEDLNNSLAGTFANALIGSEESNGFAYSLKGLDAVDYAFENKDSENLFIVKK